MIRLKTINVDGMEIERTFESVSEILKNWWDEEHGTDLSGGDIAWQVFLCKYREVSVFRNHIM